MKQALLKFGGKQYLADVKAYGESNPDGHKKLLLEVITKVQPDMVVFSHSSYGWDLASHIALAIQVAQVSEVVEQKDGILLIPV